MALLSSRCPLCAAALHTCGGHPDVSPVDDPQHLTGDTIMAEEPEELAVYTYNVYGNEVQGQLTKADAERMGATPYTGEENDDKPSTKARKTPPANK